LGTGRERPAPIRTTHMASAAMCRAAWRSAPRAAALRALLLVALVAQASAAYGYGSGKKKSKFLEAYPMIFKFFLFWWCVTVFAVMGVYIADHLLFRKFGSAKVVFSVERTFKGGAAGGRKGFWEQFADPTKWSPQHPVLQSADIRMVRCAPPEDVAKDGATEGDKAEEEEKPPEPLIIADEPTPSARLQPIDLQPLKAGLGFILRHKDDAGPRAGRFYCTRECTEMEMPKEGPWRFVMRTVEVGVGYPYDPDSEVSEVEMHPAAEDGSVRCVVTGTASARSRLFRWWNSLEPNAVYGATSMLQTIEEELLSSKKKD